MKLRHLGSRFVRALWPGPPRRANREWVARVLSPSELELWRHLPNHDQRHSIGVARGVEHQLEGTDYAGDRRWLVAALLHDVGKLDSRLSIPGRVLATGVIMVRGREVAAEDAGLSGLRGRIARYTQHPARGAALIERAGGPPEAAQWATSHHERDVPPAVPAPVAAALRAADDD